MTRKEYMNILFMCTIGTRIAMIDMANQSFLDGLTKVAVLIALAYFFIIVDGKSEK